jgi:hypothetical protein
MDKVLQTICFRTKSDARAAFLAIASPHPPLAFGRQGRCKKVAGPHPNSVPTSPRTAVVFERSRRVNQPGSQAINPQRQCRLSTHPG